jgi:hypothetical protein
VLKATAANTADPKFYSISVPKAAVDVVIDIQASQGAYGNNEF